MSISEFIHKYILKNKATSNIKNQHVPKSLGLDSKVRVYLRDCDFSTNSGTHNLHPCKGTTH